MIQHRDGTLVVVLLRDWVLRPSTTHLMHLEKRMCLVVILHSCWLQKIVLQQNQFIQDQRMFKLACVSID